MNVFELFGQMSIKGLDKTTNQLSGLEKNVQRVQKGMKIMGAAFTAVGVAGLAMIQSTKKINAELSVTAYSLGITTKEMRDLTLATTNVTFPIKEVTATFDLLARAGIKDIKVLQDTATAFDTLGDALSMSASQVTEVMIPAMKTFRLSAEEISAKTDIMTYMIRNSTISLEDFNTMVGYTDREMVDAGFTIDDMAAAMIYMSDEGVEPGRVMLREWMKAVTKSKEENISMTEALGMTNAVLETYKERLAGATDLTEELANKMNEQYTIMDKLKQKWSELTLASSAYLEPLEPILALMTSLGPLMIGLAMVGIPNLIKAVKWLGHALKTLLLNPIVALIAALTLLGYGIFSLIKHHTDWNKIIEASEKVNEELVKSEGKLTEEVLEATRAYVKLREAYGQLAPEEEEQLNRLNALIQKVEDGTLVLNKQTGVYEELAVAGERWNEVMDAAHTFNVLLEESEGKVTEGVIEAANAYIELRLAYGALRPAEELHIEQLRKLTLETEEAIAANKELLSLLGKLFPVGIPEEEFRLLAPLLEEKPIGPLMWKGTEYQPGTAGWYKALGIPLRGEEERVQTMLPFRTLKEGGIISQPTLALLGEQAPGIKEFVFNERQLGSMLHGLQSQRPYALAGESDLVPVGPGVGGGITVNIIEPHVRNDRDIDLMGERIVARLRSKGIKL